MNKAIAGVLVVLGMFLTPGAAVAGLHESTWPGCFSSAVFRDVRSCLLCDNARDCWCGWWRSCFMLGFQKSGGKKTNNPALDNNADVFSWKSWKKKRKFRKFTPPMRTALIYEIVFCKYLLMGDELGNETYIDIFLEPSALSPPKFTLIGNDDS